jgi:hypothetical protein
MSTAVAEPLIETNPNRPTRPDTCYNCGSTGACKNWRGVDGECVQQPRPLTLEIHQTRERYAVIEAMTSDQRASLLQLIAHGSPEMFDRLVVLREQS